MRNTASASSAKGLPWAAAGAYLVELRTARALTQEDIAQQVGASTQTVRRWERGESRPQMALLRALSRTFDVPVSDLVGVWHTLETSTLRRQNVVSLERDDDVRSMRALPAEPSRRPDQSDDGLPTEREFLAVVMHGLKEGFATSEYWILAAEALARRIGSSWSLRQDR